MFEGITLVDGATRAVFYAGADAYGRLSYLNVLFVYAVNPVFYQITILPVIVNVFTAIQSAMFCRCVHNRVVFLDLHVDSRSVGVGVVFVVERFVLFLKQSFDFANRLGVLPAELKQEPVIAHELRNDRLAGERR